MKGAVAMGRRPRVGVVSVHYYPRYLDASLRAATSLARSAGAEAFVAVSNHEEVAERLPAIARNVDLPRVVHLAHDNTGLEFGAYQAGVQRLSTLGLDWALIVNDTFSVHRPFSAAHRRRLIDPLAHTGTEEPLAAGEVEAHGRSFVLFGCRTHRWISTSVFALNHAALQCLGWRLYRPEVDALVFGGADEDRFFAPLLDPVLARHIRAWLMVPAGPGTWYAAAPLSAATAPRLTAKARAILQEMYLSAALEQASTWFFDIKAHGARERLRERIGNAWFQVRRRWGFGVPARR